MLVKTRITVGVGRLMTPDGQITQCVDFLSSPIGKNIWLSPSGNQI